MGVRVNGREFPVDADGFLNRRQRVSPIPSSASLMLRLFSALASSGRWASGSTAASSR